MLYQISFEVDNGVTYNRDVALVEANSFEDANKKLKKFIGSIDRETCVSEIFRTTEFHGDVFTGIHGWNKI